MKLFILSLLFITFLLFASSQSQPFSSHDFLKEYNAISIDYQKASELDKIANGDDAQIELADSLYSKSLREYIKLLRKAGTSGYDSLIFNLRLRVAYASFILGNNQQAKANYLEAIRLKSNIPVISDTVLFVPYIYTGAIYYGMNQFDSAMYCYKQAEKIQDNSSNSLQESERLYNRLGAMYYETGNYRQARNYFEKAVATLQKEKIIDQALLANYEINIASVDVKLDEIDIAKARYLKILNAGTYNNEIYHNLAIISLKQERFEDALSFLKKINYSNSKKNIEWLYNTGMVWAGLKNKDSAKFYLAKAIAENKKWYGQEKSSSLGLILKAKAGLAADDKKYEEALYYYQGAIMSFDNNFSEQDSTLNPAKFSGIFSYIHLFNTLIEKADIFRKVYDANQKIQNLLYALSAYQSAFALTEYVEKTYDTDESRLFLGKIKYLVHSKPIDLAIQLYEITQEKKYLEAAWNFDQKNKASVLSLSVKENNWEKNIANESNQLLKKQISIKQEINRLVLKAQLAADSNTISNLNDNIRELEIELGKIQQQINQSSEPGNTNISGRIPELKQIQKDLDGHSAVLSYHLSETELLIFCIKAQKIFISHQPYDDSFLKNITSYRNSLQTNMPGVSYAGTVPAKKLFLQLIEPVIDELGSLDNLIIIPDDELNYLPFESLQNNENTFLIEQFSIQYLNSASLFKLDRHLSKNYESIGFAPFGLNGFIDSTALYTKLPYSKEEISQTDGITYVDTAATKQNFLKYSNKYPVIHLATHAAVDNVNAEKSYIAFYPKSRDFLLYAPEIYNLNLNETQLVILSACETGTGQLIRGEGIMSLSRAFAYAGCANVITSLWKAEDRSTSYITNRLHSYLKKGYNKAAALQKAKLDFLNSDEISPALKTPNYWAHLIFIGNYEPANSSNNTIKTILLASFLFLFIVFILIRYKNKRITAS